MVRHFSQLLIAVLMLIAVSVGAAEQRVIKVLPHLLDLKGRHAISPSLFERDAYQAQLRANPDLQSGIRYDVHWQSAKTGEFKLKLELLGKVEKGRAGRQTIEKSVQARRPNARWSAIEFTGEDYKNFGQIVAWRVSLWRGDTMVARQQSFLWE